MAFEEIVSTQLGQCLAPPACPSEATRAEWVRVADMYDPDALSGLWDITLIALNAYHEDTGLRALVVQWSCYLALATSLVLKGEVPDPVVTPSVASAYRIVAVRPMQWRDLQNAIEAIALSWEALEL